MHMYVYTPPTKADKFHFKLLTTNFRWVLSSAQKAIIFPLSFPLLPSEITQIFLSLLFQYSFLIPTSFAAYESYCIICHMLVLFNLPTYHKLFLFSLIMYYLKPKPLFVHLVITSLPYS